MSFTTICMQSNAFKVEHPSDIRVMFNLMGFNTVYDKEDNTITLYGDEETDFNLDYAELVVLKEKHVNAGTEDETKILGFVGEYNSTTEDELLEQYSEKGFAFTKQDVEVIDIVQYIQHELLQDEELKIMTAGFDSSIRGNRNPFGYLEVISKGSHNFKSLRDLL